MICIPPNPRRVGYIDPIHGPLDGPLYMGSHIHQQIHTEYVSTTEVLNTQQSPEGITACQTSAK